MPEPKPPSWTFRLAATASDGITAEIAKTNQIAHIARRAKKRAKEILMLKIELRSVSG